MTQLLVRRPVTCALVAAATAAGVLAAPVSVGAGAAVADVPTSYTITEIGVPGAPYGIGYGINEDGVAVVHVQDAPGAAYAAFRTSSTGLVRLANSNRPWAVNAGGVVVGEGDDGHARRWTPGQATPEDFGPGDLRDVADDGTAVGVLYNRPTNAVTVSPGGTVSDLALPEGADRAAPFAVNESGTVVGNVEDVRGVRRADRRDGRRVRRRDHVAATACPRSSATWAATALPTRGTSTRRATSWWG